MDGETIVPEETSRKRTRSSSSSSSSKGSDTVSSQSERGGSAPRKWPRRSRGRSFSLDSEQLVFTMPPFMLEGDTLGEKRRHFNKLVEDAIANENYELSRISYNDSDIDNLLKIEIASRIRNVDYIIEVMKSNDMLYAATAIKKSTWLITEPQYANIINPEYLHTQLLPNMNNKTFNKLMLHIRLNLKDESRVEAFYEYLKETEKSYKWLENCSIPFIENVIQNERHIPVSLFKRLCRRSDHFLKYHKRVEPFYDLNKEVLFLLKSHTADVLNIIEGSYLPQLGRKKTEILMKTCPQRILDNFGTYADNIDLSVVAKYFKKEEIITFLRKQIKENCSEFCYFEELRHFVKNLPKEKKLEFIKKTFIDRTDLSFLRSEDKMVEYKIDKPYFYWYEYIPFNIALPEMKKHILAENSPSERFEMLSVLITCTRGNPQHIKGLLRFFFDRHINEPFKFKIQFINHLLSKVSTHNFDGETWNILDQLFHSMEVYADSENNVQKCLESIILYNVLHDDPVPEIIEQKVSFHTFEDKRRTLNQEQAEKIFCYLLNFLSTKIRNKNILNESDFSETVDLLKNALTLFKDWRKDIREYPIILQKIEELVKLKQENMWKTDMSCLYNVKKSWRKHMFEESLSLCLSEESCLNALKHKPQLLTQHDNEIDTLRTNDAVSLRRLLAKLRVYWPHSLAQHWTDAYLLHLKKPSGEKAVIKGLFALLSQNQIIDIAKFHAPDNFKINWSDTDLTEITIRKNIAKHLHIARPLVPLEILLCYSKGDYLQYAMPSLNAVMSKLSQIESRKQVLILLEAPSTSLRKFGLHVAFSKLKLSDFKTFMSNIWNSTTNSSIKSVIFKNTFRFLCKVENINPQCLAHSGEKATIQKELWTLLSSFIDKLPTKANKDILKCLGKVDIVPIIVRAEYFMKSYTYLTSVHDSALCDSLVSRLVTYARYNLSIVDSLDDDFVSDELLSPAGTKFCMYNSNFIDIFGRYALWGKCEEDQLERFRKVVKPAMDEAFLSWRNTRNDEYFVTTNFNCFIQYLFSDLKEFILSKRYSPAKLFTEIKKNMKISENYVLYTSWKLATEFAILVQQHISKTGNVLWTGDNENIWKDILVAIYPEFGSRIVKCLKEDTEQYYPSICLMFKDALNKMFDGMFFYNSEIKQEILRSMLFDQDFIPSYIVVSQATNKNYHVSDSEKRTRLEICKKIKSHPSIEVQLHYYNEFQNCPLEEV